MTESLMHGFRSFASPSTTRYINAINANPSAFSTESHSQVTYRTAGTLSHMWIRVYSNDLTGGTSTYRVRKNVANGNQSLSVSGGATGTFEDIVNTDAVVAGDEINYSLVTGTGGSFIQAHHAIRFSPTTTSDTMAKHGITSVPTLSTASTTYYFALAGDADSTANTTEATSKIKLRNALVLSNLQVNVLTNGRGTATVIRLRKNSGNGNMSISVTAAATGIFEDNSNTDSIVSGDDVNYAVVTGTGSGNFDADTISCEETSTNNRYHILLSNLAVAAQNFASTRYFAFGGYFTTVSASSTLAQVTMRDTTRFSDITINITANTVNGASTYNLVVNTVATALSASIASSTTGQFVDATNTVDIVANDTVQTSLVTGGSSGSMTYRTAGILAETNPKVVSTSESVTVSESSTSYSDTVFTREQISVELVAGITTLSVSVSDTTTLTESLKLEELSYIAKSETATITETVTCVIDVFFINKSESVNVTESQNIASISDQILTDTVSLTEAIQVSVITEVIKSDSVTITESLQRMVESYIAKSESITVTENIAVFVEVPDLAVAVADSITLFEGVTDMYNGFGAGYFGFPYFGGIDQITTIAVEVATAVTKTETVTITENLSVEHIDGSSPLTASESTTVSEAITVHLESYITNSETAIITESTALFVYPLITSSTENVSISESVHVAITTDGILSDIVSVSESVELSVSTQLSTSDNITVTELVQQSVESYVTKTDTVSVSEDTRHEVVSYIDNAETVTVGESLNIIVPDNSIIVGVSESITVSEAISLLIDPLFISKTETVAVTESNNIAITTAGILSEVISVNESVQLDIPLTISKSEITTVTDTPTVRLESYINKSEQITVTESQIITATLSISTSETATITELIGCHVTSFITKSESITVSENRSVIAELPDLFINKSETTTITESVAIDIYAPVQAPSETIVLPSNDNTIALTQNSEIIELTQNDDVVALSQEALDYMPVIQDGTITLM